MAATIFDRLVMATYLRVHDARKLAIRDREYGPVEVLAPFVQTHAPSILPPLLKPHLHGPVQSVRYVSGKKIMVLNSNANTSTDSNTSLMLCISSKWIVGKCYKDPISQQQDFSDEISVVP